MWGNFLNIFFDGTLEEQSKRQSGVGSDETTKTNSKYESDIKALKQKYGDSFQTGICIETTLKEILELCPRVRHRSETFLIGEQAITFMCLRTAQQPIIQLLEAAIPTKKNKKASFIM